ncbi:MAG: hypothetical protein WAW10_05560 [Gallionella sp.]
MQKLDPILDASGWAINARSLINIPSGTSLTGLWYVGFFGHG